ncbi:MAG TPA: dTDP-4-dehydrorhamnose 3,5-epimerase [Candidatus Binatia bacterium]|nr:dTDP-4-dehydrorhamnose 3,5-epimerase [Candidatus Binatia bacterium]
MLVDPSRIPAVKIITAKTFPDDRGVLLQSWVKQDLETAGIPSHFEQAIQTTSRRGVVRGLHFQWDPPMGKFVRCVRGGIIDVVVDVRHGSPTVGDHLAVELTDRNHRQIWVPPGFAHGTFALEDDSVILYECSAQHGPGREGGILWNDPALAIRWPDIPPIVSDKDKVAPTLAAWMADERSRHFRYA